MNNFAAKLARSDFVVIGELTPPQGIDLSKTLQTAALLRGKVDALNITDSNNGQMTLSPLAAAHAPVQLKFDPVLRVKTLDRKRTALHSDMFDAAYLGIENLVCMGGDPPYLGYLYDHINQPEFQPRYRWERAPSYYGRIA